MNLDSMCIESTIEILVLWQFYSSHSTSIHIDLLHGTKGEEDASIFVTKRKTQELCQKKSQNLDRLGITVAFITNH